MAKKAKHTLIDRAESGRFSHAVLATYSLDIPFFEASVMRHLLRNGCRNAVVFADGHKLTEELFRLTQPGHQRSFWFGKQYSLIPVHHSTAFHPKLAFLIGSEIEVFIGSGNLEPGGLADNIELYHRVICDREGKSAVESGIVADLWQYISKRLGARIPTSVKRQLHAIEREMPWVAEKRESADDARVVLGPGSDVIAGIRDAVDREDVKTLYVMSPFFDHDINALDRLIAALHPDRTVLLIQPETISVPGNILASRRKVEVYRYDPGGYLHAKLVIAECPRKSVLFAGSHNVSERAFAGKNYEASLIRISNSSVKYSDLLELSAVVSDENKVDLSTASLTLRKDEPSGRGAGAALLLSAQVEDKWLEVLTRKSLDASYRLLPVSQSGVHKPLTIKPVVESQRLLFALPAGTVSSAWTGVAVKATDIESLPVPLIHVRELEHRAESTGEREIGKQIRRLCDDIDVLPDLLSNMSALLMASRRLTRRAPSSQRKQKAVPLSNAVNKLSYEDFVIPWELQKQGAGAPARRSNLEIAIAAIANALDGKPIPKDVMGGEVEELPDEIGQFADKAVYGEEALAGGRLEDGKAAVEQLEYDPDEDRVRGIENLSAPWRQEERPEPSPAQAKLRALRRSSIRLRRFSEQFPAYVESLAGEDSIDIDLFETLSQACLLVTQFLNRQVVMAHEAVMLLEWETWADFMIGLLDVLTSSETRFFDRVRWGEVEEANRSAIEKFAGYLAVVERICRLEQVEFEDAARILIGLLRVSRQLGVGKGLVREKAVGESAGMIAGAVPASVGIRRLNWAAWAELVSTSEKLDDELRMTYHSAAHVAARQHRDTFWPGDWVWWQNADGHIGIVISVDNSKLLIACEPGLDKQVAAAYVVRLDAMPPVREIIDRARRAYGSA